MSSTEERRLKQTEWKAEKTVWGRQENTDISWNMFLL